jgi:nucleoside-diphosphate-sugar epimerase
MSLTFLILIAILIKGESSRRANLAHHSTFVSPQPTATYETTTIMTIKKVVLAGANGKLGPAILHALLSAEAFTVTVLSRSSSISTYPAAVHVARVSDDFPQDELVHALRGQDALVVVFAGSNSDLQIRLADAAAQAGVRRFVPADFGSCDSSSARALELVPLYRAKQKVRRHLQQLAEEEEGSLRSGAGLSWTSLVCGHFFDFGLKSGLLGFDLKAHRARLFDGGDVRWSATTTETIAKAVVRVLQHDVQTRNRMLYIQSFCVTQNEVLRALQRVVTGQSWQVERLDSDEFIRQVRDKADQGDAEATEELVGVVGIVDSNWEGKDDFANSLLGLETEDLDHVVRQVVSS